MSENGYNNWKNRETWNVALWLDNEESFYYPVKEWARENPKGSGKTYKDLVKDLFTDENGKVGSTPDGVNWDSSEIDGDAILEDIVYVD